MITLIIETCTERGLVAIAHNNIIIAKKELPFGYQNSKYVMPAIQELLNTKTPNRLIVGVGPGSYTGIRIGAVIAKTYAYAWNIPLIPVSTLEAFAHNNKTAIIDAKISGAYLLLPNETPTVCPLENLPLAKITTLITPNAERLKSKINLLYPNNSLKWEEQAPSPELMLQAAQHKTPQQTLELLYLRQTQAEINLNQKATTC